jgi:SAM-dependent methyltransferase
MPWEYSEEYYREYTRTTWNAAAEAYVELMGRLAPLRSQLIELLAPKEGEAILDLGTGPGEPALTIARMVGRGRVTGVDLSERMVAIAREAAQRRGSGNVHFRAMDCAKLDLPDRSFDGAVSCFGFQIFTDPEGAARETWRVLKPGGRIAVSVWSTGAKVPFLDVIVAPMLTHAEPDASGYIPTPYETGGPGEMVAFLLAAGFEEAIETRVTHSLAFATPEEYFDTLLNGTPLGHSLSEESPEVQAEIRQAARANLERWKGPSGYVLPAECVLVRASRPKME